MIMMTSNTSDDSHKKLDFIIEDNIRQIIYKLTSADITKAYTATWIDKESNPFKYEFRGLTFQGWLNPEDITLTRK